MNSENFIGITALIVLSALHFLILWKIDKVSKKIDGMNMRLDSIHKDFHAMDMRITINEVRMEERKQQVLLPVSGTSAETYNGIEMRKVSVKRGRKPKSS